MINYSNVQRMFLPAGALVPQDRGHRFSLRLNRDCSIGNRDLFVCALPTRVEPRSWRKAPLPVCSRAVHTSVDVLAAVCLSSIRACLLLRWLYNLVMGSKFLNYELVHYQLSKYLLAETPQGGVEQNNMPCLALQSHAKFHDAWHRRPIGACTLVYFRIVLI